MNHDQSGPIAKKTLTRKFDAGRFLEFVGKRLNTVGQAKAYARNSQYVKSILSVADKGRGRGAA